MQQKIIRQITLSAMFIAMGLIFDRLLMIPLGEVNRIAFGSSAVVLASLIVGPIYGMIVGAFVDIFGFMLNSVGTYTPFVTFGYMAMGLFPWFLHKAFGKASFTNLFQSVSLGFIALLVAYSVWFIYSRTDYGFTLGFNEDGSPNRLILDLTTPLFRVIFPLVAFSILVGFSLWMFRFQTRLKIPENTRFPSVQTITFIVLVSEVLIGIIWGVQWRVWYFQIPQTSATTAIFYFNQIAFFIVRFPVISMMVIYGIKTYLRTTNIVK
jgi:ECF transporter S component (folate family)